MTETTNELNTDLLTDDEREAMKLEDEKGKEYFDEDTDDVVAQEEDQEESEEDQGEEETEEDAVPIAAEQSKDRTPRLTVDGALADIEKKIQDLDSAFDEGEIESADYRAQMRDLERQRTKVEVAQDFNRQSAEMSWEQAQDAFYAANGGKNVMFRDDPILRGALDVGLRQLYADPDAAGKSMGWYLENAAAKVLERFPTAAATGDVAVKPTTKNTGRGALKDIPKTLGGAPAAEENRTGGGGAFSHLENLDGMDLELAVAAMTDKERDRWLETE